MNYEKLWFYLTMITGMMGAVFASDSSMLMRRIGFMVWMVSNVYLMYVFNRNGNMPMVLMYMFYEIMNLRGIYNNW